MTKNEALMILMRDVISQMTAGNFWNDEAYEEEVKAFETLYGKKWVEKMKKGEIE